MSESGPLVISQSVFEDLDEFHQAAAIVLQRRGSVIIRDRESITDRAKESAPFVIKPDPSQIDELGRIKMTREQFEPLRSTRLTPPCQDFVQLGAFDKEKIISRDIPVSLH